MFTDKLFLERSALCALTIIEGVFFLTMCYKPNQNLFLCHWMCLNTKYVHIFLVAATFIVD